MNNTHREQKLSVGDRITLGRWPQGADGRVEPICWQVLEVREDRALVLSEFVLDARPFHDAEAPTRWKHSALRAWLNGEFLQGAFSDEERARLFACEPQADPVGDAMWREMNMDDATESPAAPGERGGDREAGVRGLRAAYAGRAAHGP